MATPTEPESYHYQPILHHDGIRLIQLQPSQSRDSIIHCELIHTRLRTVKQDIFEHYTALSYVWGDATQITQIMVGGQTLEVTKSLDSALKHLRDENRVLSVWADGVCINQNGDVEKGTQVQQMGKVYETADHTVIFLGECDAATQETLSAVVTSLEDNSQAFDSKMNQDGRVVTHQLLERPWFTRVWVYQELVMSRDPWVQYGRVRFPWSLFRQFVPRWYGETQVNVPKSEDWFGLVYNSAGKIINQMEQSRSDFMAAKLEREAEIGYRNSGAIRDAGDPVYRADAKRSGYAKLLEILVSRRGFGASDSRDLVFSIIGLSEHVDIRTDYEITTADVYRTVAWKFMTFCSSLEILSYVEDIQPSQRMPGLGSWAPDWTAVRHPDRRIRIMPKSSDYTDHKSIFSIPEEHEDDNSLFYVALAKTNLLGCKAYRISKVRQLSSSIENLSTERISKDNSVQTLLHSASRNSKIAWMQFITIGGGGG